MRGARVDQNVRQGADLWIVFRPLDSLATEVLTLGGVVSTPAVPSDLTGMTFRCQFRAPDTNGSVELDVLASDFAQQTDTDGKTWVVLHVPAVRTKLMTAPKGAYDIEATDSNGVVTEVMWGLYGLSYESTKPAGA